MRRGVLAAGVVALLAVAAVVVWWPRGDEGPAPVSVPRVEGADVLSAQRRLAAAGLRLALEDPPGATVAESPIASQRPPAGARVQQGRTVSVTLRDDANRRTAAWDDFEDPARSWFEANSSKSGEMRVVDGGLVVTLHDPRAAWREIDDFDPTQRGQGDAHRTHSRLPATGARIDADVRRLSGSWQAAYGLTCAGQDGDPSYLFLIDGGSGFAIFRSDRAQPLRAWGEDVFTINARRNHLAAECRPAGPGRGVELTFWANSAQVAHVRDQNGISPSFFGAYVSGAGSDPVEVRFDNFVFQPLENEDAERSWWQLQPVTR